MEEVISDLLMVVKKHELQGFQKNKALLSELSALEVPLNDVYGILRPSKRDYANRRDLIRIFNEIAWEIYGNLDECPLVEEFGSFSMDMFNVKSDLDLSINFSNNKAQAKRRAKIKTLQKFENKLYILQERGHVTNVQPIFTARVPVLKVTDRGTGIECDLSVGNMDGVAKSHILHTISGIDDRFRKLSYLMKAWAKANHINSSKDGTLNSLSLILLVAFHLQTRDPPILPRFSAIFEDGADPVAVKKKVLRFYDYGKRNKESLAELFVSLLVKLESVETLWLKGLCASVYDGSWKCKILNRKNGEYTGFISIEDFTNKSHNTARAVWPENVAKIYNCIRHTLQHIQTFIDRKIDAAQLKRLLFGSDLPTKKKGFTNVDHHEPLKPVLQDPIQRKRKCPTEEGDEKGQRPLKKSDTSDHSEASLPSTHHEPSVNVTFPSTSLPNAVGGLDKSRETAERTWGPPHSHSNQFAQGFGGVGPGSMNVNTPNIPANALYPSASGSNSCLPMNLVLLLLSHLQ